MPQCVRVHQVKQAALDLHIVPTRLKRNSRVETRKNRRRYHVEFLECTVKTSVTFSLKLIDTYETLHDHLNDETLTAL